MRQRPGPRREIVLTTPMHTASVNGYHLKLMPCGHIIYRTKSNLPTGWACCEMCRMARDQVFARAAPL